MRLVEHNVNMCEVSLGEVISGALVVNMCECR